jgi:hypothetical protein
MTRHMKSIISVVVVFFVSLLSTAQTADTSARARSPLELSLIAGSKAVPEAQKAKDIPTLKRLLADDFQYVSSEGRLHKKDEFLDDAGDGILTDYSMYNVQAFPVNDGAALVTYDAIIHQSEGDAPGTAPRYQYFSDLWVKQGDQWKLKFQQATPRRPID